MFKQSGKDGPNYTWKYTSAPLNKSPSLPYGSPNLPAGAETIAISLTTLFNRCIFEGKWPQSWKKGEWLPVFKRDNPLLKENYKPITVLAAVDKVFEQVVTKQIVGCSIIV